MITQADFENFERYYTLQVLKNPNYRYGQAFINEFGDEFTMTYNKRENGYSVHDLWEERNSAKARQIILEWISDDSWTV